MSSPSAGAGRNLMLCRIGSVVVMVQNTRTPTDREWDEFLEVVREDPVGLKLFVHTEGGAPSTDQRRRLQHALDGNLPLVAAVSDSMKVRFVAATILLFHSTHKSYTTKETSKAYDHLGMTTLERREVDKAVHEMKEKLS